VNENLSLRNAKLENAFVHARSLRAKGAWKIAQYRHSAKLAGPLMAAYLETER
jgi:hypothetical protein